MQLIATHRSHFSRKVRLLLDHLGIVYELVDAVDVSKSDRARFGANPLMNVPVWRDGDLWMIDADHIAQHIVREHDPADRFEVLTTDPDTLNARAVMNGVMANEVKIVMSERLGSNPDEIGYMLKCKAAIRAGLAWLEERADAVPAEHPTYLSFHFIALWDHVNALGFVEDPWPKLEALGRTLGAQEAIARSAIP